MPRASWVLSVVLAGAWAYPVVAQEKFAVIVGVDDYVAYEDEPGGDLRGAEHDALVMRDVLVNRWGIPEGNVHTLLSLAATKAAIHEAITGWLASATRPGNLAVFYFAGHGSQALDEDGDEPDGLDETLAPTDVEKLSSAHDIRDDELREWLAAVPADVVVILDSCHSGSATRATGTMRARVLNREPPAEGGAEARRTSGDDAESMADGSRAIIEIAAAAPSQAAMEGVFPAGEGKEIMVGGAFTYHMVRQLWRAPPTATYAQLLTRVVSNLKADQFTQDPQLEGPVERELFAVAGARAAADVTDAGSVRVVSVENGQVVLWGGDAQGATVGSLYRAERGAVLRIVSVGAESSTAEPVSGLPATGEVATALEVALPDPSLAVDLSYLPPEFANSVRSALSGLEGVAFVGPEAATRDMYLRLGDNTRSIELGGRSEPSVEVLGKDGGIRGLVPRDISVVPAIGEALLKELAVKRLAVLDNPAAPFQVELALAGGKRVFRPGDPIDFAVRTEGPGYLTLVDLGMDGTVTVLHPLAWDDLGRLGAGQRVELPGGGSTYTIGAETGLGIVVAIVTPVPLGIPLPEDVAAQSSPDRDLAEEIRVRLASVVQDGASALEWATSMVAYEVVSRAP